MVITDGFIVSIQLVSPSSGDMMGSRKNTVIMSVGVSIQLVSPASGDLRNPMLQAAISQRFHSISVPSEWGLIRNYTIGSRNMQFPFN